MKICAQIPEKAPRYAPITLKDAENWCDTFTIKNPEGIYWYPSAKAIVLIRRTDSSRLGTSPYEIICIESSNLLYPPGQTLGYLSPTGNPKQLTLALYSNARPEGLSKPKRYVADYNPLLASFSYHKPRRRITINPIYLLPRLFRVLRIDFKNQDSNSPESLQRIYPKVLTSPNNSFQLPLYF